MCPLSGMTLKKFCSFCFVWNYLFTDSSSSFSYFLQRWQGERNPNATLTSITTLEPVYTCPQSRSPRALCSHLAAPTVHVNVLTDVWYGLTKTSLTSRFEPLSSMSDSYFTDRDKVCRVPRVRRPLPQFVSTSLVSLVLDFGGLASPAGNGPHSLKLFQRGKLRTRQTYDVCVLNDLSSGLWMITWSSSSLNYVRAILAKRPAVKMASCLL